MSGLDPLARWRLVLGEAADAELGGPSGRVAAMDAALAWLYDRESEDDAAREVAGRQGSRGPSRMGVPEWIDEVHRLFPRSTLERIERDALERYALDELVTNPEVLARVEPSEVLLRAVLRTKHLMNPAVLAAARRLVAEVVRRLMERLATEVRTSFSGARRRRRSRWKVARNFDFRATIHQNLRRWDPARRTLGVDEPRFSARVRPWAERWRLVLLVDQSGSMVSSVIHTAVTAACLWSLPGMEPRLVAFDTEVVDLSGEVSDPVELLLRVQLGGGTDLAKAVAYGASLVDTPRRSLVVLVSDLYEGGPPELLVQRVAALVAQGTRVLVLASLDEDAAPAFDRAVAQRLADVGAAVGAMTPGELVAWVAEQVGR